jgi:transcriptional regulator with XRE-family HTH domain
MSNSAKSPENQLGERLKTVRKFYGLSQTEFGEKFGLAYSSIGSIERGEANLMVSHMAVLHDIFHVNLNWLVSGSGSMILDVTQPSLSDTILSEIDPNINTALYKSLEDKERIIQVQEQLIEYLKKDKS